jgi:hypothetical protein
VVASLGPNRTVFGVASSTACVERPFDCRAPVVRSGSTQQSNQPLVGLAEIAQRRLALGSLVSIWRIQRLPPIAGAAGSTTSLWA